jgi:hypothetical protein
VASKPRRFYEVEDREKIRDRERELKEKEKREQREREKAKEKRKEEMAKERDRDARKIAEENQRKMAADRCAPPVVKRNVSESKVVEASPDLFDKGYRAKNIKNYKDELAAAEERRERERERREIEREEERNAKAALLMERQEREVRRAPHLITCLFI